ncbi:hypothetical protein PSP6_540056 [Paraburkholderia tropica]|uniref:hypothetical protein n=1 Tax=Paraburkholderia tropica TaxID=92647 RepID=UPI001CB01B66|nr:hypothetical protein [Paraburkholderia tropica]CAG9230122.1 hypothetical protein PSP6_540056 [Paraburkholderia tropica]
MPRCAATPPCPVEEKLCELVVRLLDYLGATEMGAEFERIESDCLFGDPSFLGGRGAVMRDPQKAAATARTTLAPLLNAIKSAAPQKVRKAKDDLLCVLDELCAAQQSLF